MSSRNDRDYTNGSGKASDIIFPKPPLSRPVALVKYSQKAKIKTSTMSTSKKNSSGSKKKRTKKRTKPDTPVKRNTKITKKSKSVYDEYQDLIHQAESAVGNPRTLRRRSLSKRTPKRKGSMTEYDMFKEIEERAKQGSTYATTRKRKRNDKQKVVESDSDNDKNETESEFSTESESESEIVSSPKRKLRRIGDTHNKKASQKKLVRKNIQLNRIEDASTEDEFEPTKEMNSNSNIKMETTTANIFEEQEVFELCNSDTENSQEVFCLVESDNEDEKKVVEDNFQKKYEELQRNNIIMEKQKGIVSSVESIKELM